ncbi:MAG: histidine phosphatase family protein [Pseudomonadota bacterium]|nr:MAG: histidine phosphatase family protein [Pseudomonadota bacterium]
MQIWLLRHAQARPARANEPDRERPLTESGRETAVQLGRWLADRQSTPPDLILVSPALRTRQTADAVLSAMNASTPRIEEALWEALEEDLVGILNAHIELPGLMLVGHNPGMEWLVQWLSGQRPRLGMQTGTLAVLSADMPPGPGCARITQMIHPSDLT